MPSAASTTPPGFSQRDVPIRCADGRLLKASWYEPACGPVHAVAVISAAMAVSRGFYRGFAEWMAARGYAVLSYDYRGIGESRDGPLAGESARLRDWAQLDMSAALHAAQRRRLREQDAQGGAEIGLLWIGHSFGGNAVGLVPEFEHKLDAVLGVAAQAADWRFWRGTARAKAWLFFHALLPGFTHAMGRTPQWLLGARAERLPKPAALEWARWGRRRGFMFTDPSVQADLGYHRFAGPVHLWNFTDDHLFGPAAAVDHLALQFSTAKVIRHTLAPRDLGLQAIGHFAMFRRDLGARIWPLLLGPVEAATPRLQARLSA